MTSDIVEDYLASRDWRCEKSVAQKITIEAIAKEVQDVHGETLQMH